MKINVLGTEYEVKFKDYKDDPMFEKESYQGYCSDISKEIVIGNKMSFPGWENENPKLAKIDESLTLRHEIVHAFLSESGLGASSIDYRGGWAKNEEMVDWVAMQAPKIFKAYKEAGCL